MKDVLLTSLKNWLAHEPFGRSAAAAYYAIFSMPGLMLVTLALAGIFFDRQRAEDEIIAYVRNYLGTDAAQSVRTITAQARLETDNLWAILIGIPSLLYGATGLFAELQASLNRIWEVEVKGSAGLMPFLKARLTALGVILAVGFVLLVSMTITALLSLFSGWLATQYPEIIVISALALNFLLNVLTTSALFAVIFKVLPDAYVRWRHALRGGLFSAVLFIIGQYGMMYYFRYASPESAFGAAGSLILIMLWVSYSCLILFMGAEFTKTYAERVHHLKAQPTGIAKRLISRKTP